MDEPSQQHLAPASPSKKGSIDEGLISSNQLIQRYKDELLASPETAETLSTADSGPTPGDGSRESSPTLSSCPTTPPMPQLDGPTQVTKSNVPKKRKLEELADANTKQKQVNEGQEEGKQPVESHAMDAEEQRQQEEKRQKEEEKARKQAVREANAEKKRKALEKKAKNERSQQRLNAFFTKPAVSAGKSSTPSPNPSRRVSITNTNGDDSTASPSKKPGLSDYEKTFLPFCIQSYVHLAKSPFEKSPEWLRSRLERIDDALTRSHDTSIVEQPSVIRLSALDLLDLPFKQRRGLKPSRTIREIMSGGNGTSNPTDLTEDSELQKYRSKLLSYHEDIRPPYEGTFSRRVPPRSTRKLARNPFSRDLPDTNYDYDSEAEWEPPQEGDEDLVSDEDEPEDSEDEEDLEGFLDDENDDLQRQKIVNDMQPVNSGLCWEDEQSIEPCPFDLKSMKARLILDSHHFPIDPYSTSYWPSTSQRKDSSRTANSGTMQPPPRAPLQTLSPNTLSPTQRNAPLPQPQQATTATATATEKSGPGSRKGRAGAADPNKQPKLVNPEALEEFKSEIVGKTRTKIAMIEDLKQRFPKISKETIKDSLGFYAERRATGMGMGVGGGAGGRGNAVWVWKKES